MKKEIKGFTLVELLSIITILGIIVILVVPQIGGSINSKKEKELEKIIDIVESAGKAYHTSHPDEYKIPLSTLVENGYLTNNLKNPITGEKLDGCVSARKGNDGIFSFIYRTCEVIQVSLDVEPNGGTLLQKFEERYIEGSEILLMNPTKDENDFVEWRVVRGNGYIVGDKLKLRDTDTEIFAVWQSWPTLTLDLDEGTIENNFGGVYKSGTIIELTNPTKVGYVFSGWVVASDNSVVSGNTFTMGSEDTTLKATWKPESLIYSYSCANTSGGEEPYNFTYTGNCTIIDDGNDNWRVKFLTSGTFTPNISTNIDVFLVGGGGGGSGGGANKAGGGGGYTLTKKGVDIITNTSYTITIGSGGYGGTGYDAGGNGGPTSAFSYTANGGSHGYGGGGSGGSGGGGGGEGSAGGGRGGVNGGNGSAGYHYYPGGSGQGTTTREFGESSGTLYSSGGSGGPGYTSSNGASGGNNTGNGAGGSGEGGTGGTGGSGIVVIRNARG